MQSVMACLESGIVSTVGETVVAFEEKAAKLTERRYAVATNTGTSALHLALLSSGVRPNDMVVTQAFSFVATCNAILYCSAEPVFVDIDRQSLGMSVESLLSFLERETFMKDDGYSYHRVSGKRVSHCLPVCTFGHSPELQKMGDVCKKFGLKLIVDAAEALGSESYKQSVPSWGDASILSFNGNKVVTCGGGGMLLTNDKKLADIARSLSVQARQANGYQITYQAMAYNYRMPNLNASLGISQLNLLHKKLLKLRELASAYHNFFEKYAMLVVQEPEATTSNYWLNGVAFNSQGERDHFIAQTNREGILTRPAWTLLCHLSMYKDCFRTVLPNADWAEQHLALLPSFVNI